MTTTQIEQVQAQVIEITETEYHNDRLATTYFNFASTEGESRVGFLDFNPESENAPNFRPGDRVNLYGYTESDRTCFQIEYYEKLQPNPATE